MSAKVLDDWEALQDNPAGRDARFPAVRFFFTEAEAQLYVAILQENGIRCFLSNTFSSTMLPQATGGIALQIHRDDLKSAMPLLHQLDRQSASEPDESFHDADHDDILYEKKRVESLQRTSPNPIVILLVTGLLMMLLWKLLREGFLF